MRYKIFPPIGVARVGGDADFFLGPEIPGAGPQELAADGTLSPVRRFKNANRRSIRKQGARFHVFQSEDGNSWVPAVLPPGARVTWSVTLLNKKAATQRSGTPPVGPSRPQIVAGNEGMILNGGTKTISGPNAASEKFMGHFTTTGAQGQAFEADVELGQLRTDGAGRLIVLGGKGTAGAPPGSLLGDGSPQNNFYRNPKWFDDVADGPVKATIELPGEEPVEAEGGAWVGVAPPDYAPGITGVVTLFDVLTQIAIQHFQHPMPTSADFQRDIAPLLERIRRLRWVHTATGWSDPRLDDPNLANPAGQHRALREAVRDDLILLPEAVLLGHVSTSGPPFELREFQHRLLDLWVEGTFTNGPAGPAPGLTADGLTRAALEGTVGQGFCPGIEMGILVLDRTLYADPFDYRFKQTGAGSLSAGDLTALMAQPWQADFLECAVEWWPTQRPDIAADPGDRWARGIEGQPQPHEVLVAKFERLGFITQVAGAASFEETERANPF